MTEDDEIPPPPDSLGLLSTRAPSVVRKAAEALLARFEEHGYNPTPVIDLGVIVAEADGEIDEAELKALRSVIGTLLGAQLKPEVVQHLVEASQEVLKQAGVEPRIRLVAEILHDCDAVEPGILVALAIAFASGFDDAERKVIHSLASAAGVTPERRDELIAKIEAASKRK